MSSLTPDYYKAKNDPDGLYEPKKVARVWGLNFALGNVLKYIKRRGEKHGGTQEAILEDLRKARAYLHDEITFLEQQTEKEKGA